jgi:hypothetical protein
MLQRLLIWYGTYGWIWRGLRSGKAINSSLKLEGEPFSIAMIWNPLICWNLLHWNQLVMATESLSQDLVGLLSSLPLIVTLVNMWNHNFVNWVLLVSLLRKAPFPHKTCCSDGVKSFWTGCGRMRWIDRVEILAEDGSIESEELQLGLSQLSRWICSTAGFEVCFHTLHMLNDSRSRFLASACVPYSGHVNWLQIFCMT